MNLYQYIAKFIPRNIKNRYARILIYSTVETDSEQFIGFAAFVGITLGFIIASILSAYKILSLFMGFVISIIIVEFCIYLWLILSADSKAKFVENVLPDALQLMASNMRAGLTTDKALLLSARPEFGILAGEIRRIGKETMAGKNFSDSLKKITERVKSKGLERSIELIVHSLKSGGQMADLLDQTADDMRDQQIIEKEVSASVLMYAFFIVIAVGIGAPTLFAMSSFLVKLLTTNLMLIAKEMPKGLSVGGSLPIAISKINITPEFVRMYSMLSLGASSLFGSIIIGLILKGEEKEGLKYFPLLLIISIGLFLVIISVLESVLGGMLIKP